MKKIYTLFLACSIFVVEKSYAQNNPQDCPIITDISIICSGNLYTVTINYDNPGGKSGLSVQVLNDGTPINIDNDCFKIVKGNNQTIVIPNLAAPCGSNITVSVTANVSPQCTGNECGEAALPISLVSFTGEAEQKFVKLQWQTAQEVNNEMFKIQKSTDGTIWRVIGQLNGAINSNTLIDYQFVDKSPVHGYNYYRLIQQDLDGQATNSQIIQVDYNSPAWEPLVTINTVTKNLQVFSKTVEGKATLRIYNLNGQILFDQRIQDGSLQSLSHLPAGSYLCQMIDQQNVYVKKFILSN